LFEKIFLFGEEGIALSGWCEKSFSDALRMRILPLKCFRHRRQRSSPLIIMKFWEALKFKMRIAVVIRSRLLVNTQNVIGN